MKFPPIIAIACFAVMLGQGAADSPATPVPWMTTSERGDYLFKMVPAKWRQDGEDNVIDREAFGIAYQLKRDGEFEEIWRTQGWYAFEGYLSEDGRYFVRFGLWASDQEKHTDLAIAFYDRGKLIKQYEVRRLIRKPDLLEDSVSHYLWRPAIQTKPNGFYGGIFHLVMIDRTTYSFDYETGKIINRGKDKKAKSMRTIWAEKQAADNKRGQELLEVSAFRHEFERHFEITRIEAMRGSFSSCSLEGPAWVAEFTPKRKLAHKASVRPVFPIRDDERVEVSLTPQEILSAFEKAFQHPFVKKRFADGGATGIRLRIQGDRLHWNTPELVEFTEKITGTKPMEDTLAHWAYFIIDAEEPRYTSIYFNTKTGEIIDEDESKWPWEPYLIDPTGKRVVANRAERAKAPIAPE